MNSLFKTVTSLSDHRPDPVAEMEFDSIYVRDLVFDAQIGVYPEEKGKTQKLKADIEIWVSTGTQDYRPDNVDHIMSYEHIVKTVQDIAAQGHIDLLEHFAIRVLEDCLSHPLAVKAAIALEKTNMFGCGESSGVKITRQKNQL